MIEPLSPAWIDPLARLLQQVWPDWYGPAGQGSAHSDLCDRCGPGLPRGWVALVDQMPVATVALSAHSFGARPGETPWLTGLCTAPNHRGIGIGTDLIATVESETQGPIYTTTREAAPLFLRRGWHPIRQIEDGWQVLKKA